MSEPFISEIRIFAGNFAPRGWAFCNGQLLPISQHTALFSLVGTTYGGDGESTLSLPDLQGRAPMHPGQGPGLTSRRLGQRAGSEQATLTEAQLPSHHHPVGATTEDNNRQDPSGAGFGTGTAMYAPASSPQGAMSADLATTGGGQQHNNLQPFLAINFIIALEGIYPS